MNKVIILRPGALGDVLALRDLIACLRRNKPMRQIGLVAPGERGRFFFRQRWVDSWLDWERSEVSWLFNQTQQPPPSTLASFFDTTQLIVAFLAADTVKSDASTAQKLALLCPDAALRIAAPVPPPDKIMPIGKWLVSAAGLADAGTETMTEQNRQQHQATPRLVMPLRNDLIPEQANYALIHPGSGSAKKNWPLESFAMVGEKLQYLKDATGKARFPALLIVAGEADGNLGRCLHKKLPDSILVENPDLSTLASLLAGADFYLGNDSGVSHLAGAVVSESGERPKTLVIFGLSDSRIWAPQDALVLQAGPDMSELAPEKVWQTISELVAK